MRRNPSAWGVAVFLLLLGCSTATPDQTAAQPDADEPGAEVTLVTLSVPNMV